MAERVGFEPTDRVNGQRFSRPPHSTTLAPLHWLVLYDPSQSSFRFLFLASLLHCSLPGGWGSWRRGRDSCRSTTRNEPCLLAPSRKRSARRVRTPPSSTSFHASSPPRRLPAKSLIWRRGRDSNPRLSFPNTRFPGVHLRPLGHLSVNLVRSKNLSRVSPDRAVVTDSGED